MKMSCRIVKRSRNLCYKRLMQKGYEDSFDSGGTAPSPATSPKQSTLRLREVNMEKTIFIFCGVIVALCSAFIPEFGPSKAMKDATVEICHEGEVKFVADVDNLCWYWECVETVIENRLLLRFLPRRCALGSKMPYSYDLGKSNPCSINFNDNKHFECTRALDQSVHKEPECFKDLTCYNNGTATYQETVCWCICPDDWQGNFDCSEPTKEPVVRNVTANSTDCFQKVPPCDLAHGCENNGVCHNQCGDFWCECQVPFTNGKRCEGFSCDANPCHNGGSCNRGQAGIREVSRCICPPGFHGYLCEFGSPASGTTARLLIESQTTTAAQIAVTNGATQPQVTDGTTASYVTTQGQVTEGTTASYITTQGQVTEGTTASYVTTQGQVTEGTTASYVTTQAQVTDGATQPATTTAPYITTTAPYVTTQPQTNDRTTAFYRNTQAQVTDGTTQPATTTAPYRTTTAPYITTQPQTNDRTTAFYRNTQAQVTDGTTQPATTTAPYRTTTASHITTQPQAVERTTGFYTTTPSQG